MRISDWSSDVCSSDLGAGEGPAFRVQPTGPRRIRWDNAPGTMTGSTRMTLPPVERTPAFAFLESPLDRAEHLRDDAGVLAARWPRARVVVVEIGRAHV